MNANVLGHTFQLNVDCRGALSVQLYNSTGLIELDTNRIGLYSQVQTVRHSFQN